MGDIVVALDGTVWVTWVTRKADQESALWMGSVQSGEWRAFKLVEGSGFYPGALLIDEHSCFHLTWHDIHQDVRYLTGRLVDLGRVKRWRAKWVVDWAHRSALLRSGGKTLIAYEDYGSIIRYLFSDHLKEYDPDNVEFHGPAVSGDDRRLAWETCHSQQVAVDRYGVPWLFFINSSREHLFYARWLGGGWGPLCDSLCIRENSPRLETNHAPIRRLAVEAAPRGESIGLSLSTERGREIFHSMPVPSFTAESGRKVLFLDLKEIQEMDGLTMALNPARKHPANPIVRRGRTEDFDAHGAGHYLHVLKEDGLYRMWYLGWRVDPRWYWAEWQHIGYSESRDGVYFKKIPLGLVPFGRNRKTNIVPGLLSVPFVYRDDAEPDPERRYKALEFPAAILQHDEARQGRMNPWKDELTGTLLTSPDGLHWKGEPVRVDCPGGRPVEIIPQSFFRDARERDPNKRFKAYGFSSLNLGRRGGSYMYSPDCIHWMAHPDNPVLDAFARCIPPVRGGKVHQIHDMVVWPCGEYYLALYEYQRDGEVLDIELAMSRDGERFSCVRPGEKVIPVGDPECWDSQFLRPSVPVADGERMLLYYGGMSVHGPVRNSADLVKERRMGGLATMRKDGFTHLQLLPGRSEGHFSTLPFEWTGGAAKLQLNCDCRAGGYLTSEVVDAASGKPVAGYSGEECLPIRGDTVAHQVRWRRRTDLSALPKRTCRLRFHFHGRAGSAKLYTMEFA